MRKGEKEQRRVRPETQRKRKGKTDKERKLKKARGVTQREKIT